MNILFLGNSFTFYNNMPEIFAEAARSAGKDVHADKVAFGGHYLHQYADFEGEKGKIFLEKLEERKWDIVVLQDQSFNPALNFDDFYASALKLIAKIREEGVQVMLYQTWAYDRRSDKYNKCNNISYEELFCKLKDAYTKLGDDTGCRRVPVGEAFNRIYTSGSDIPLFAAKDLFHPSEAGSYLIACMFCYAVFGMDADIRYDFVLAPEVAQTLRDEAKTALATK